MANERGSGRGDADATGEGGPNRLWCSDPLDIQVNTCRKRVRPDGENRRRKTGDNPEAKMGIVRSDRLWYL